ncbi:MAG TPA: hypothetical protein VG649_03440, partial [Candidatus Angelobacter sp.]|nr:hypothetical protein [Candidatus Angelobacter sp.]
SAFSQTDFTAKDAKDATENKFFRVRMNMNEIKIKKCSVFIFLFVFIHVNSWLKLLAFLRASASPRLRGELGLAEC